jgi:serine/threonine-protein kinase
MSKITEWLDQLPPDDQARLQAFAERFEDAWQRGEQPEIEAFLPADEPERLAVLVELVHIDLERRLKAGLPAVAESYLERYPDLASDPDEATGLLLAEYGWRARAGQAIGLEDYLRRFPQYAEQLRQRWGAEETAVGTPFAAADTGNPSARAAAPGPEGAFAGSPRYRPIRFHARGARGEVHLAEDTELRRRVALKRIQAQQVADPESRRRFLREAEVTARLEHPGIVPVHGLVAGADGGPCYAMRFVEGPTLQDALRSFHEAERPGRDAGERSLALRKLLAHFIAACNAVAYAHDQGVVHRDLKPGNILLGARYGETLVVDWGLAKVLDQPNETAPADGNGELPPASHCGGSNTEQGQALGTPVYMSPEQAAGRWDMLGPASDVYGLGATLYAVLTGRPPFAGNGVAEVLQKVQRAAFPPPRQLAPDTPRALEAICLKALAREPSARYATALELAADLERWLADQPVTAWREPLRVRSGRWVRRHKPAVAALAAAVLVGLLLGGLGLWSAQRHAEERRRGVEGALRKAAEMQGKALWGEARALLEQAQDRLGPDGPADLQQRLERARKELRLVATLDAIRLQRATAVEGRFNDAGADQDYAAAFQDTGLGAVGEDTATVAARIRASGTRQTLVDALDDWALTLNRGARLGWVLEVGRRADPDPWRNRVRAPKAWSDRAVLTRLARDASTRLAAEASADRASLRFVGYLAMRLHRLGGDAEALLRAAQGRRPADFWLNFLLGSALSNSKRFGESAGFYRVALAVRPDAAAVRNNLGIALAEQGKLVEAVLEYRRAIALSPKDFKVRINLGNALARQGKPSEAAAEYRRAIALDPKLAAAHYCLGYALAKQGRETKAAAEYRRAVALDGKSAYAHHGLALALDHQGKRGEAENEYRRAIALDRNYASARFNLGLLLENQGRLKEAEEQYRGAIALEPESAPAYTELGIVLAKQGKLRDAMAEFQRAIALDPKSAKAHMNLGIALFVQGKLREAIAEHRRAIDLGLKSADAHYNLGCALAAQGQRDDAMAAFRQTIALDPNYAEAYCNLGFVLRQAGRFQESLDCYRRGHQLRDRRPGWRYPSAQWVKEAEHYAALDRKLPAILDGSATATNPVELMEFARFGTHMKRQFLQVAALFKRCFASHPNWANRHGDVSPRYFAAATATMAASHENREIERHRWREQARHWLQDELDAYKASFARAAKAELPLLRKEIQNWRKDGWLSSVRNPEGLKSLPDAERVGWEHFWADVDELLRRAGPAKK